MSAGYDPVPDIERLGYTEREATFLCLVCLHTGYFLRRQFLHFIERDDGAMVQRFLRKAVEREHVCPIEYQAGRHVYHAKAKLLYRLISQPDSQNRREKSDQEIQLRLMQLDYILDHPGSRFLESERAKEEFFHGNLRLPLNVLPRRGSEAAKNSRYFPDRMPIGIRQDYGPFPMVSLAFVDEGQRSLSAFARWLEQHSDLLRMLPRGEVVYVAGTERNFEGAEHEFQRRFSRREVTVRGHLLQYDYPLWSMKYRKATR